MCCNFRQPCYKRANKINEYWDLKLGDEIMNTQLSYGIAAVIQAKCLKANDSTTTDGNVAMTSFQSQLN